MALAFQEAQEGIDRGEGGPFGAVIVKENRVIARAHNEVLKRNDPTAHAEILAIQSASAALNHFHLSGCVLYTTGEPCPMCFAAIHWAHLEKVVYCMSKADAEKIGFDDTFITDIMIHKIPEVISFVHEPAEVCHKLYTKWFESSDKIVY